MFQLRHHAKRRRPPRGVILALLAVALVASAPMVAAYRARGQTSARPRVHLIQDMDHQPRLGAQAPSALFADGRAARPPIEGAIAQGHLADDDHYYRGYTMQTNADGEPEPIFFDGLPDRIEPDAVFLERGRLMYRAMCSACHGVTGRDDGTVHQWMLNSEQPGWTPPTQLNSPQLRDRPDGHLYNTIRQGIRNMPAHGSQINVQDRWAIVAYLRQLQAGHSEPVTSQPLKPE